MKNLTEIQKLYPKDSKIYVVADMLIEEDGRAVSWHIRSVLNEQGIYDIKTPQVNYYMNKMVEQGKYLSEKGRQCIIYTPSLIAKAK